MKKEFNKALVMAIKYFHYNKEFVLESDQKLPEFTLAYTTLGELNSDRSNVVWVCHALTASSEVDEWWPELVGGGKLFDPAEHFIICVNVLGSHYGSTSPLSINPLTDQPYYHTFPLITIRDIVASLELLREELGLHQIKICIGGSLGGQQALEWSIQKPGLIQNLILMATNARHSAWGVAFNEAQRMAIEADQTWKEERPDAGLAGMKAARATALLSYRHYDAYAATQTDATEAKTDNYKASSYQRYQGEKLAKRFNAFSYWTLSKAMDSHNVGRDRGGALIALRTITSRTLVIGISSDMLFPVEEQKYIASHMMNATYVEIDSPFGHDGFLVEAEALTREINSFFSKVLA